MKALLKQPRHHQSTPLLGFDGELQPSEPRHPAWSASLNLLSMDPSKPSVTWVLFLSFDLSLLSFLPTTFCRGITWHVRLKGLLLIPTHPSPMPERRRTGDRSCFTRIHQFLRVEVCPFGSRGFLLESVMPAGNGPWQRDCYSSIVL